MPPPLPAVFGTTMTQAGKNLWRIGTRHLTTSTVGCLLLGLISSPLLARSLGPSDRGELAAILLIYQLVPQCLNLSYFVAIGRASQSDCIDSRSTTTITMALSVLAGCLLAVGATLNIIPLRHVTLYTLAGILPFLVLQITLTGWAQRQHAFAQLAWSRFIDVGLSSAGIILFALMDWLDLVSASVWYFSTTGASAAYLIWGVHKQGTSVRQIFWTRNIDDRRRTISFLLRYHPARMLMVALTKADVGFVAVFYSSATLGRYAVATSISDLVVLLPSVMQQIALPLSASYSDDLTSLSQVARRERFAFLSRNVILLGLGGVGLFVLLGRPLTTAVFGSAYSVVFDLGIPLLLSATWRGCGLILESFLAGQGKPTSILTSRLSSATVLFLGLLLWGRNHIEVVAVVTSIANLAACCAMALSLGGTSRSLGVSSRQLLDFLIPRPLMDARSLRMMRRRIGSGERS